MSYGITAYTVDINQLKSVVGSNDEVLASKLKNTYGDELVELDEFFEDDIDVGEPSVGEIIDRILSGDLQDVEPDNAQYGYVLELICREIGFAMYPNCLIQLSIDWISSLPQLGKLGMMSGSLKGVIPLPLEFPGVGCIDNDDIEEKINLALAELAKQNDDNAKECYEEYIGWLNEAKNRKAGLVTFLY